MPTPTNASRRPVPELTDPPEPNGSGDRITEAYETLRDLIVGGRLAPGSRIVEREFAARLEISRTPVRSALHRLQQEGYINVAEGGRLLVAPLTQEDAHELFGLVGELEGYAVETAARLPGELRTALANDLRKINEKLQEAARARRSDPYGWFVLDSSFHHRYIAVAARPRTRSLLDAIKPQAERYARLYVVTLGTEIGRSLPEHERIIQAIEAGDAAEAAAAVRANWRNAAARLSSVIVKLGERGIW